MSAGVSVIVCCYNSGQRIAETTRHLREQKVPRNLLWEVIIVNNASTDNTVDVATASWNAGGDTHGRFRVVEEFTPGLSAARKKGVDSAAYDVLIFCDDDNHLDPDYIIQAYQLLAQKPDVAILGGWVKPKLPADVGNWIVDFYPALAIGRQAPCDGYVDWVFGAGMVLKKEVFTTLDRRNIRLLLSDRLGKKQTSGGDSEICMAARFVGYKVYYSEALVLYHQIAPHRLRRKSFFQANYKNVFPVIYTYLMNRLSSIDAITSVHKMYHTYLWGCVKSVFHFFPRCILGRHQMYSAIILFQNLQLIVWLLSRKRRFGETVTVIRTNLYHDRA